MERRIFNHSATRDERVPVICPETDVSLAFWGRLDNRDNLAAALDLPPARYADMTDAQLVLSGWRHWGESLPEHLLGDFALAILDPRRGLAFLARDPLGVKPLYYRLNNQSLAFATSFPALRPLLGAPPTPDPDWAARYLLKLSMSHRQTGYQGIIKLPAGHCLSVDMPSRERLRRWHQWRDDSPLARHRDQRWVDDYRALLEKSIRCRMKSDFPLASENSGGLDSATITAFLAHFLGGSRDQLYSLGIALCEQEPDFILETSRTGRIVHNYIVTSSDSFENTDARIDKALQILGYPEEQSNGSGHTPFYRECLLRGIRTLFSGFGGDETVTNPGHLAVWEFRDQHQYDSLWNVLPGNSLSRALRLGKTILTGHCKPAVNHRFLQACKDRWPYQLLRLDVVRQLNLHQEYLETARHDGPHRRINDFVIHLLNRPAFSTRLENCTLMAASYGVDYRWPLCDVRLVQQYLSTPSLEKVGPRGMGRYLHRRAIAAVVPQRIAWNPYKDMGYGELLATLRVQWVRQGAEDARRLDNDLHPLLDELINRKTLRAIIRQAELGKVDAAFAYSCRYGVGALNWLDRWLKMT